MKHNIDLGYPLPCPLRRPGCMASPELLLFFLLSLPSAFLVPSSGFFLLSPSHVLKLLLLGPVKAPNTRQAACLGGSGSAGRCQWVLRFELWFMRVRLLSSLPVLPVPSGTVPGPEPRDLGPLCLCQPKAGRL